MSHYRVVFDRIGRTHNAPSLVARVAETEVGPDYDVLAARISDHARPYLASPTYRVFVEMTSDGETGTGHIFCGAHSGGTFCVHRLNNDAPRGADPQLFISDETAQESTQ